MQNIKLEDFNLESIGNSLQLGGLVFTGREDSVIILLPNEQLENPSVLSTSLEEYKSVIRQMDVQEVTIVQKDGAKVILRKSQRNLDTKVSWQVFKRDNYTCRYCGNDNVPMTYDHIHLWEKGGDNTVENGVAACKKCNKTRGNTDYAQWLETPYYLNVSKNLSTEIIQENLELVKVYHTFEDRKSKRTR